MPARQFSHEPPMVIDPSSAYTATVALSTGRLTFKLEAGGAPRAVNNFVFLARAGFYDGLTIHRLVPTMLAQGGCPYGDGSGGPGYFFDGERPSAAGYTFGTLASANGMADGTDGSQFFVCLSDLGSKLPPVFPILGRLAGGSEVLQALNGWERVGNEAPRPAITIRDIRISNGEQA